MKNGYNTIILIFDTLRPDYLGCYGRGLDTPAFEAAADQGVVFEAAFGTAPGTPVSHASLYSGQYPSEHGVTGQYIDVPESVPVLAEWFRDAGYETFGITGPSKMGSDWGYDRGFDELFEPYYDLPDPTSWRSLARSLTDRRFGRHFARQLTRGGREKTRFKFELLRDRIASSLDRPFLAVSNFTTVHAPYDPPRPYKQRLTPGYSRPPLFLLEYLLDDHGAVEDEDIRLDRVVNVQTGDGIGRYIADPSYLNEKEVQLARTWYAAAVSYLDDELARFMRFYRRELQDDTVLILTADHGEQLGEHGLWEHSHRCHDETLQVPLVVIGPDVPAGERRSDLASHVDIFDTLCDLCGVTPPAETSGHSLFGDRRREAVYMEYGERDRAAFAETGQGHHLGPERLSELCAGRKAVRTDDYRYELTSDGTEQLFRLPEQVEVTGRSAVRRRLRRDLLSTLGETFGHWPEGDPDDLEMNGQVRANLRRLGYIE
jgi:arylsulfatase A-like enzyme